VLVIALASRYVQRQHAAPLARGGPARART
jgi:hypothetical protein